MAKMNILNVLEKLDPAKAIELSDEQIIDIYTQAGQCIKDVIEPTLDALKTEMLARLEKENVKAKIVNDYSVTKAQRVNFNITLEEAETFNAVKKVIDQSVLKRLWQSGAKNLQPVITEYLMVRPLPKPDEVPATA